MRKRPKISIPLYFLAYNVYSYAHSKAKIYSDNYMLGTPTVINHSLLPSPVPSNYLSTLLRLWDDNASNFVKAHNLDSLSNRKTFNMWSLWCVSEAMNKHEKGQRQAFEIWLGWYSDNGTIRTVYCYKMIIGNHANKQQDGVHKRNRISFKCMEARTELYTVSANECHPILQYWSGHTTLYSLIITVNISASSVGTLREM